ncbi:MAG TPA: DUF4442 domain-containing protein [Saprospiraceae bacterium]|nr:DUF4442 domain-containing protein [Saprospiraceae bacterium]HMQ83360.1 DUF4442 domain-containing protein [Saprospiraceae bacterium]
MAAASTTSSAQSTSRLSSFIRQLNTPWKIRLFFLSKLPSCWFWGVRVKHCDAEKSEVSIPFKWSSKNPFKSTYFAALCGAAELSTGLLALIALHEKEPVSMLVTQVEAHFYKKAAGKTYFRCQEGKLIEACVQDAINSGEGHQIQVSSLGYNEQNELVCEVKLTWSFKRKRKI